MPHPPYTWLNGAIVPWEDSRIHINTDVVLRGASVFEGIRAYRTAAGGDLRLFRAAEHLHRLLGTSARVLHLHLPYTADDLQRATVELLRANDTREHTHVRVVAYFDEPELGEGADTTGAFVLAFPRPHSTRLRSGIRSMISAWRRPSDLSLPPRVKASGSYLNGRLAVADAKSKGFDIPILLNEAGKVSEGPGQNLFLVRDGVLVTPRVSDAILEGVTRLTVLRLASDHGIPVEERAVDATELYVADELFFAGTLIEIQPIVVIDSYDVGNGTIGPVTERIQDLYLGTVTGRRAAPPEWFTSVYDAAAPLARLV